MLTFDDCYSDLLQQNPAFRKTYQFVVCYLL